MKLYGILPTDVESIVARPMRVDIDERGNPRVAGSDKAGRAIIVVVASDDSNFVITAFPED